MNLNRCARCVYCNAQRFCECAWKRAEVVRVCPMDKVKAQLGAVEKERRRKE